MTSFLDQPVWQFLDRVAARAPAPGGGGAAAVTAALAAGLVAMAARFSEQQFPGASDLADQADQLRHRAARLVDEDAHAYRAVLDAYALPREDQDQRGLRLREALHGAAVVPLEATQIAARIAGLASQLATAANANLRGDIITAALLAESAAASAASLVDINVGAGKLDTGLSRQAADGVTTARAAARQVSSSLAAAGRAGGGSA